MEIPDLCGHENGRRHPKKVQSFRENLLLQLEIKQICAVSL